MDILYHGSSTNGIQVLQPRSKMHNSAKQTVYLTGSIPYALVYIWDQQKTGTNQKWVTCGLKNRIVYYEEQFPDQLRAFYEGVEGYLYTVEKSDSISPVSNRENMYFSSDPVPVKNKVYIPDVYQELCKFQEQGTVRLLKYADAAPKKQEELIQTVANYIRDADLICKNSDESNFFRKYFKLAWRSAEGGNGISKASKNL